jgi:hypothetical protein
MQLTKLSISFVNLAFCLPNQLSLTSVYSFCLFPVSRQKNRPLPKLKEQRTKENFSAQPFTALKKRCLRLTREAGQKM